METIQLEKGGGVAVLELYRPHALNALNTEMLRELDATLTELEQDKEVRCLVITGSGERAFAAGADIAEMADMNEQEAKEFAKFGCDVFDKLENLHCPVIAAVNGFCLGGGMELALACDMRLASMSAKFGLPEVTLGVMPGFGGTRRLAKLAGTGTASEMMFTGGVVDAQYALEKGIVNSCCEDDELRGIARNLAEKIAKNAPIAIAAAKKSMWHAGATEVENTLFAALFDTKDQKTGMHNFVNKIKTERFDGE